MLLELQNLGKSFGEHEVLRDVNAGVERGDRIGIIGANGTGKTTLLRILCGESLPDAGDAAFGTGVTTGYLEQNARLDPALDVYATMKLVFTPALDAMQQMETLQKQLAADPHNAELTEKIAHCTAVIDAMDAYNMDTQIKKVLNGMGFPADTWAKLAGVLSGGEQTRLRLARLLLERPDLLILDEPTNHLDLETMEWLENYLKAYRGAVLVVSHDRYFLDAVCTRIWELRGKSIKTYRGNYSAYLPQREAADERQQKLHDAAVEKAAKLQDYVDRNLVRASTTKMAQSRRKQLEKLEIVEAPTAEAWELNFRFEYDIEPYDELVIMKNLSVHIGERTLIDALDYVVHRGDKLVIAGPNGAGKSTLLQVLDGKRRPSGGMVRLGSGAKPGVFTQQQARRAGRVIDAIWNQYPRFTELEVRSHLARFGYRGEEVFKDCASLSGGELARLRFAELALERPNLMFLDEPTNHLDLHATEWLEDYVSHYKGTVLVISHDRYFLDKTISRVVELKDGKAEFYSGNYSFYAVEKEKRYLEQLRQYKKEQAELQRLSDTVRMMHEHNTEHLNKRAFSIEKRMAKLNQTARPDRVKKLKAKFGQAEFHADDLLSLRDLSKTFGERTLFHDVTLRLEDGDRVALLGDNGTGKSTLLKIILGEEPQDGGVVKKGITVKTGYLPQQIRFAHPERSLYDTMLYDAGCDAQQARDRLGRFLFQGEDVFKPVSVLSGGEQSRLRLCMLMDEKVNFLILDEPTNHLDLDSREWIEEAVEEYEGALLFVSHDRYFIDRFATRIWTLENGVITDFKGDYAAYQAWRERQKQLAPPPKPPKEEKVKKERPKRTGGTKQLKKDLAAAEKRMEKLDQLMETLNAEKEAAASDYQKLQELAEQEAEYTAEYDALMEKWEVLSEAIAAEEG